MNKNRNRWIIGSGCVLVFCLAFTAFLYFFYMTYFRYKNASKVELENILIDLDLPETVKVGDVVDLNIKITNTSSKQQQLDSIDLYSTFLEGFSVIGSEPPFFDFRTVYPGNQVQEYITYGYLRDIPGNTTEDVTFKLKAENPGSFQGFIFICVNSSTLCNYYLLETMVESEGNEASIIG